MSFSDHKITQFTHKITDLPDQPNLPADELKARFDSSPEELRQSVNGICDDAAILESTVDNIITQTFEGTIDREMLSDALVAELDAKAEAADLTAEATTRAVETSSLGGRMTAAESTISTHTSQIAQKCELYCGAYTGDGASTKTISLGFTPKAVLIVQYGFLFNQGSDAAARAALTMQGHPAQMTGDTGHIACEIITNGFRVGRGVTENGSFEYQLNYSGQEYLYLAFR